MSRLGRLLGAPRRWWSRSLSIRVVTSSVAAALIVFGATGWLLVSTSSRGILEAKTRQSVSEASAVLASMQIGLRDADLRRRMGKSAKSHALDAFAQGPIIDQYEAIYERVLSPAKTTVDLGAKLS